MNNNDFSMFQAIVRLKQEELLSTMTAFLQKMYQSDKVHPTKSYILAEGDIPILLVAHLDTVFKSPPVEIYFDEKKDVLWSPQGLGADDRAGVFIILKLIQEGLRPHVCFTTDEEIGGVGASMLVQVFKEKPFDIKYAIQLDRQGVGDSVYYDCDNPKFEEYINKFGYVTAWGSFSDIGVICPAWEVAGVNLSVGYVREHSTSETLFLKGMYATMDKVRSMLRQASDAKHYKYIPAYISYPYSFNWSTAYGYECPSDDDPRDSHKPTRCFRCGKTYPANDLLLVTTSKYPYNDANFCYNCITDKNVRWCEKCGEPFLKNDLNEKICPFCLMEADLF